MMLFCNTCMFLTDKQGPGKICTCRRVPPMPVLIGVKVVTRYPEVSPDMRACGEHKPNKRLINVSQAAGNVKQEI